MEVDWKTWNEVKANLDQRPWVIPRMKGRRYKALQRANARWLRDPVVRCKCGRPDGSAEDAGATVRVCPFGQCHQFFCPGCGRQSWAYGPVGCPCDSGPTGHHRYAEQPKPHVKVRR